MMIQLYKIFLERVYKYKIYRVKQRCLKEEEIDTSTTNIK